MIRLKAVQHICPQPNIYNLTQRKPSEAKALYRYEHTHTQKKKRAIASWNSWLIYGHIYFSFSIFESVPSYFFKAKQVLSVKQELFQLSWKRYKINLLIKQKTWGKTYYKYFEG